MSLSQPPRLEKVVAVNELQKHSAIAILELADRAGLTPEETAWVLIGVVAIALRNRAGPTSLPKNLRAVAQKLHDYAARLEAKQAQPTDDILVN